ncbi:kinase-like domain-containing protein [Xylaria cf. heliscus]|nr:kinase-like domain-containing protein [Xylaria cf. heliscus]
MDALKSSGETSLDFVYNELINARRTSFWYGTETPFFADKDILKFSSKDIIEKVVLEDDTIEVSEKPNFIDYVYKNTRRLFLMFIYTDLPIHLLKVIGYVDADLPLPVPFLKTTLDPGIQIDARLYLRFDDLFTTTQWKFAVPRLLWNGSHVKFHANSIPPITSMTQISSGSYGGVYSIEVDPTYVTEDIQQPLALKITPLCYPTGANGNRCDSRERDVLYDLRRFGHEHIIRLLASFEYLDHFCMIFPLATCDLHKYMDQEPQKNPTYVSWLLRQPQGLTDALLTIHGTDVPGTDPVRYESGYHRDLKPENILFYKDIGESHLYGTLQISDFGLARLHSDTISTEISRMRSATTLGTSRYAPPEFLLGKLTTVPYAYDMWSFGCIILELLIWNQFGKEGRKGFLQQMDRLINGTQHPSLEIQGKINPWFERLKFSDLHPSLSLLLEVVEDRLLVWDPNGRWTSAELLKFFSTLKET